MRRIFRPIVWSRSFFQSVQQLYLVHGQWCQTIKSSTYLSSNVLFAEALRSELVAHIICGPVSITCATNTLRKSVEAGNAVVTHAPNNVVFAAGGVVKKVMKKTSLMVYWKWISEVIRKRILVRNLLKSLSKIRSREIRFQPADIIYCTVKRPFEKQTKIKRKPKNKRRLTCKIRC